MKWQEHRLIRDVTDADAVLFPVLVRATDGKYAVSRLTEIRTDTSLVTSGFDDSAINRDLNTAGSTNEYAYLRVLESTPDSISLSLEEPGLDDHKVQGWYRVTHGRIMPQRILFYFGPAIALGILGWAFLSGLIVSIVFFKFVVRKRKTPA